MSNNNWHTVRLNNPLRDELRKWYALIFEDNKEDVKYERVILQVKNNGFKKFAKVKFYYKGKYINSRFFSTILDLYKDTYIIPKKCDTLYNLYDHYDHYAHPYQYNKYSSKPVQQTPQYKSMKKRIIDIVQTTKIPIISSKYMTYRILKQELKTCRPKKHTTKPSGLAKFLVCLPGDIQGEVLSFLKPSSPPPKSKITLSTYPE